MLSRFLPIALLSLSFIPIQAAEDGSAHRFDAVTAQIRPLGPPDDETKYHEMERAFDADPVSAAQAAAKLAAKKEITEMECVIHGQPNGEYKKVEARLTFDGGKGRLEIRNDRGEYLLDMEEEAGERVYELEDRIKRLQDRVERLYRRRQATVWAMNEKQRLVALEWFNLWMRQDEEQAEGLKSELEKTKEEAREVQAKREFMVLEFQEGKYQPTQRVIRYQVTALQVAYRSAGDLFRVHFQDPLTSVRVATLLCREAMLRPPRN